MKGVVTRIIGTIIMLPLILLLFVGLCICEIGSGIFGESKDDYVDPVYGQYHYGADNMVEEKL